MKKILLALCFLGLIGVVGCAKSNEQKRYDDIQEELKNLDTKKNLLNQRCDDAYANFLHAQKIENKTLELEYAEKAKTTCDEAKSVNQKVMDLAMEAIKLVPYLKD